jgi:chloramphenicol 3-O-phosphotransferase
VRRAGVVLLGGVSRSGKTVAASALSLALRAEGTPALHVSLDRFIQPLQARSASSTVRERNGFPQANARVNDLLSHAATLLPSYDPLRRDAAPGEMMTWADGVLIVEGLLASTLEVPDALRVQMVAPRGALEARRRTFYAWKGLAQGAIERVLADRDAEDLELGSLAMSPRLTYCIDDTGRLEPKP